MNEKREAADERQVDFEQWQVYFGIALEGTAGTSGVARSRVELAAAIADEAVAEVRRRRAAAWEER
ncbi:MAG TPA: hypothetical protein VHG72_21830 [Polyangia bacterium]|nr:hypothetical protein [Polyangia bacterium]